MHKSVSSGLNNAAWQLIEAIVPAKSAIGHPREVVDAIFCVQRERYIWPALAEDVPPANRLRLHLWQKLGTWQSLHDCLRTQRREAMDKKPQASVGILDSRLRPTKDLRMT
ncbi:transposase [Microcoleus sp. FACHB-672]|uniref:transposase n=1 Tax=Microcoleus sp. FACHB-672 TaxID=2692825 RepID=UPI0016856D60|nr:transposase [Microcoleus sp. FACHB-672]MBD2043373.1 transposase [Microcoleus sp. FACHB-672]